MSKEYDIVIADTSCFILLEKIDELNLLRPLFGQVITTTTVADEYGMKLPDWVKVRGVKNLRLQNSLDVDEGEASAIALESEPSLLVIDDNNGRKVARKLGLNITGTLGVFLYAKRMGVISAVRPLIEKIQLTNFRYSEIILQEILSSAGE